MSIFYSEEEGYQKRGFISPDIFQTVNIPPMTLTPSKQAGPLSVTRFYQLNYNEKTKNPRFKFVLGFIESKAVNIHKSSHTQTQTHRTRGVGGPFVNTYV